MLKVLIKKQFSELFNIYFRSGTKKKKSGLRFVIGIALAFLIILSLFAFFGMAELFGSVLYNTENCWTFFSLFGIMAFIVSVIVNAFMSSSMLFKAKDNSFLLSMPIPPKTILLSRMSVLYVDCAIFTSVIWIPISINYCLHVHPSIASIISLVLLFFILPLFCLTVACLLGWLISFLTRNQLFTKILTVIGSVILVMFVVVLRVAINSAISTIANNIGTFVGAIAKWGYPIVAFGQAATGNILSLVIVTLIALVLFFLMYFIMSKTFISIVTSNKGTKKAVYKREAVKQKSISGALFKKELRLFFSIPTYMVNAGLGVVFIFIAIILLIWQIPLLKQFAELFRVVPEFGNAIPACMVGLIGFFVGMDAVTTPSVSLEGRKNIWILHSLPINPYEPLKAKIKLHLAVNVIPSVILAIIACVILEINIVNSILVIVALISFILLTASFGMFISIKRANLDWTNVIVPIKQNIGVLFSILFGIFLSIIICVVGIFVNATIFLTTVSVVMIAISLLINKWLKTKGAQEFASL